MNILLLGYGKMGKAIETIALQRNHCITHTIATKNYHQLAAVPAHAVDVALEFTQPAIAFQNIKQCIAQNIPVVSGTTGWLQHKEKVDQYCLEKQGAFLYATNFSIGVHIFFKMNTWLARIMNAYPTYTPQLEETHHTKKKDTPSGTAVTLAQAIIKNMPNKKSWTNATTYQKDVLGIVSKRKKNIPGTHTVTYTSPVDTLQMTHTAHGRAGFALGAVLAAEWIQGKKGVFTMDDVLAI